MDAEERAIRQRLKDDYAHYASKCLKIRTKEGSVEPFLLNKAQRYIHDQLEHQRMATGKIRAVILKGRQQGCSTYIEGRFYWKVTHRQGVKAFILTHDQDATNNLFEMAQRYHEYCPSVVRPPIEASNSKELSFAEIDSGYKLGTAGNKAVGRSSTIQYLHGSEVAFWPNAAEHAKGILQAVPDLPDTEVILESTANGLGNYFHQQWQKAESGFSEFIAIFIPWFWQDEYKKPAPLDFNLTEDELELKRQYQLSDEQTVWRRSKINELSANGADGEKAFKQEYPCTAAEAFQTSGEDGLISPDIVIKARKNKIDDDYGQLIIGVDPARFGDDRTAIIRRKGRLAYKLETHIKKDTMQVAGIVHTIIEDEKPDLVCVDIGGLGAGVYDRLKELGHADILIAVNGGATPLNARKYFNKRAEMWGEMKLWLSDICEIPDSDELQADLCVLNYKIDSNSRIVLEKKSEVKKRGLRSPDGADSLSLTFSCPDTALKKSKLKQSTQMAKTIMTSYKKLDNLRKKAYGR